MVWEYAEEYQPSTKLTHPNRATSLENEKFCDNPLIGQPLASPLKMKIFWPIPNFYGYPDFGLEGSTCSSIMKTLKSTQFCKGSKSFKQQLILMKMKCIRCKYNLIHFTCSYDRWLYYYRLKSETKWFWMKNYDGLFSTLIHICHITILLVDQ